MPLTRAPDKLYTTWGGAVCRVDGEVSLTPVEHPLRAETYGGDSVWKAVTGRPKTLIIHVHSFSGTEAEISVDPARSALLSIPNAVLICPRLYGPAGQPNTCGSEAQHALLDSIIAASEADFGGLPIILSGVSGGGGYGPTYIGARPGKVKGGAFWCGYHDLAAWYGESVVAGHVYDELMDATFGGGPTGARAATYLAQSPKGTLNNARDCVIYINDGMLDADIPSHHRMDMRDQLLALPASANVDCRYIGYPAMGHAIDYAINVAQINALIAA